VHRGWRRSAEDEVRRRVILDLMCRFRLRFGDYAETLQRPFAEHFATEIAALDVWQQQGLVQIDADGLQVTELGRLFIRNLCMPFDTYLPAQQRQATPMFSRTV
jgi:oxygen-independent coproporphyrinogen-3 oxidase